MSSLAVYLQLTPEFGGTRFGPFEQVEVRLGSDSNCDITLNADLGIEAVHVSIMRQPDDSLIVAPAHRTAGVYLWRARSRKPTLVSTATACRSGESFSLVSPEGPRFIVQLDELPEEIRAQRSGSGGIGAAKRNLSPEAMKKEARRRAMARVLKTGPAQMVQNAIRFVTSGAILRPRNLFAAVGVIGGWVWGGVGSCRVDTKQEQIDQLENSQAKLERRVAQLKELRSGDPKNFAQLVSDTLDLEGLVDPLGSDAQLREAIRQQAQIIFENPKGYDWLFRSGKGRSKKFRDFQDVLMDDEDLSAEVSQLLPYTGVTARKSTSDRGLRQNAEGERVCTAGPARMTYAQAVHLDMSAPPDALILQTEEDDYEDMEKRREAFRATAKAAGLVELELPDPQGADFVNAGPKHSCLYFPDESDQRTSGKSLARVAKKHLNTGSKGLSKNPYDSIGPQALAKFFAADLIDGDFASGATDLSFEKNVSSTTASMTAGGDWVLTQTAQTIARAIVLPCIAALNMEADDAAEIFGSTLPSDPVSCLILNWELTKDASN